MSPTLRIAIAQTHVLSAPPSLPSTPASSILAALEANLRTVVQHTENAAKDGADVIVFPEYFLQGIVDGREYMVHPAKHALAFISSLAKYHNISIVGTIVEPRPSTSSQTGTTTRSEPATSPFAHIAVSSTDSPSPASPDNIKAWNDYLLALYPHHLAPTPRQGQEKDLPLSKDKQRRLINMSNTAYFVEAATGDVVGRYEKKNLWIPERDYLVAGENNHEVFDTKWGKAGLLICWDLSRPKAAADLAEQGADIIFAPTFWTGYDSEPAITRHSPPPDYELTLLRTLSYSRSFETETALVMCNAGGPVSEGYIGGSGVWMPFKGCVAEVKEETGLKVVDVDLRVLKESRETYQIRSDHKQRIGSLRGSRRCNARVRK